jgi:hypothetical protein
MIWLVGINYKSLEWPNGLARATRQSVRVAVRIPMNTRIAILGVILLPSLRRTQFLCRSCVYIQSMPGNGEVECAEARLP